MPLRVKHLLVLSLLALIGASPAAHAALPGEDGGDVGPDAPGAGLWAGLAAMAAAGLALGSAGVRTALPRGAPSRAMPRRRALTVRRDDEAAPLNQPLPLAEAAVAQPETPKGGGGEEGPAVSGAIAEQHARFEAALNNMTQGLCMLDAEQRIIVHNRRFAAMFGEPAPGTVAASVLPEDLLEHTDMVEAGGSASFTRTLEDGRVIAVTLQPLPGGGSLATYDDITERHRAEARLMHMARHDALTGLPNRVLFRDHTEHALAQLARGAGLAVLCLDLDHFKAVNDTLGHPIGDALLMAVAQRLLGCVREGDLIVRLGGDEFALVQVGSDQPQQARQLAERIIAALGAPFDIQGQDIAISTSIGIVVTSDARASSDELLKSADIALYKAKAEGRGTYRFFEAEMDARIQARRRLEIDLRHALAEQQFEVHYQPYVSVRTGAVTGAEALVRWRHPTRGLVSPAEFIPVAEETGLIRALGLWVLNQACADAMTWPDYVKVSVNLSPVQFRDRDLADKVADALERSGLPAHRLELEITESLLLKDSEAVLSILHEMRAHGVRIAMDDFGTGYSSLSYLRRFPFDKIKIDQSFVRNLTERADCIAIVRAVIGLGRSLGMTVIAEGVETEAQFSLLASEGCDQVQGYLFSAPQPIDRVSELIGRYVAAPVPA